MSDARDDLDLIARTAREAGAAVMEFYGQEPRTWDKGGNDPVTEADYAANAIIKDRLMKARPDYGWLSEESADDESRLSAERSFVIDPIDGTRAFIKGREEFVVSIGVLDDNAPFAGVLYDPCKEVLYSATRGGGAFRDGERLSVSGADRIEGARRGRGGR